MYRLCPRSAAGSFSDTRTSACINIRSIRKNNRPKLNFRDHCSARVPVRFNKLGRNEEKARACGTLAGRPLLFPHNKGYKVNIMIMSSVPNVNSNNINNCIKIYVEF